MGRKKVKVESEEEQADEEEAEGEEHNDDDEDGDVVMEEEEEDSSNKKKKRKYTKRKKTGDDAQGAPFSWSSSDQQQPPRKQTRRTGHTPMYTEVFTEENCPPNKMLCRACLANYELARQAAAEEATEDNEAVVEMPEEPRLVQKRSRDAKAHIRNCPLVPQEVKETYLEEEEQLPAIRRKKKLPRMTKDKRRQVYFELVKGWTMGESPLRWPGEEWMENNLTDDFVLEHNDFPPVHGREGLMRQFAVWNGQYITILHHVTNLFVTADGWVTCFATLYASMYNDQHVIVSHMIPTIMNRVHVTQEGSISKWISIWDYEEMTDKMSKRGPPPFVRTTTINTTTTAPTSTTSTTLETTTTKPKRKYRKRKNNNTTTTTTTEQQVTDNEDDHHEMMEEERVMV